MPLIPSNFAANSLSGTVRVSAGYANVVLTVSRYAFEDRTKTFTLRLRRDGFDGPVIAQSNLVTLTDFSEIVSLTANTSTVAEGNLVSFTLVTANVVNGSNVFFSVLPVTANITAGDFFGANTGRVTINSNQGTFALFANADYSLVDEANETFRVQIRTVEPTGNIVFVSSNVAITDFFKRINIFRFEENSSSIVEGTSVTFTVFAQNLATGTLLHYYTTGNASISGSNTGSIAMNSVSNTITITSASAVPANESRSFNLVLSESSLGPAIATSNAITVVDSALAYMNATGGTVTTIDGFRIHTFTTSNTFSVSNFATASFNTANVLVIAGGGSGGGGGGSEGQGGGAGGFVSRSSVPFSTTGTYIITVGAGGSNPAGTASNGSNSIIGAANYANIIAVGGGRGGNPGTAGGNGGSGGGAAYPPIANRGSGFGFPSPTQQGFPGGAGDGPAPLGYGFYGGGGGAGGAGGSGQDSGPQSSARGGSGGAGAPSTISGTDVTYAGGGGAGDVFLGFSGGTGGSGGGGFGIPINPGFPTANVNGTVNLGGGGGGTNRGATPAGSGGSGIVIIRYPWRPAAFFSSVTANSLGLYEGTNVSFIVNTTFANAVSLFYDTVGNVTSSNFVGGNTGSFTITSNATVLTLQTIANIPENESRNFALRIREDSVTGNIVLVSSNVGIFDDNQNIYVTATGGNVFTVGGFRTHIFTASNTFAITDAGKIGSTIEYYMVAGGAGGITASAPSVGGGGGAGGVLFGTSSVVANTYVVTVGAGGAAGAIGAATNGGNTSIVGATTITLVAAVGGGVGGFDGTAASVGGSGGGGSCTGPGARTQGAGAYGSGTFGSTLQGFAGGEGAVPPVGGGGGGGSGGAGTPANNAGVGNAGPGSLSPLSSSIPGFFGTPGPAPGRWFAGGGGGGGGPGRGPGSAPVSGGGGAGGSFTPGNPEPGTGKSGNVNTGGGAGSSSGGYSPAVPGGTGGSGIVVIRYPFIATPIYTSVTTANTLINEGANVTFTIRTENANANVLFYTTVGNVISADFVGGNTGSFTVTGDTTTLTLSTNSNIPMGEERTFQLQVRRDSTTGPLKLTSNTVYIYDSATSIYINATGGNVFTSGGFRTHIFTSSNNFAVTNAGKAGSTVEYFMVAGGGGGGRSVGSSGGGGGAGGVLFGTSPVVANTYVVTVGGGGAGSPLGSVNPVGGSGGNTSIIGATVIGPGVVAVGGGGAGGGGLNYANPNSVKPGVSGGSGGGGSGDYNPTSPTTDGGAGGGFGFPGTIGSTMQGFPGGVGFGGSPATGGAGGGGAGGRAANVGPTSISPFPGGVPAPSGIPTAAGGPGGIGISSPLSPSIPGFFGTPGPSAGRWFAGGGGGGGRPAPGGSPSERGLGGAGGGGMGSTPSGPTISFATAGNVNTGGGGGGDGSGPLGETPAASRTGGSGIVIIRYPFA